MLVLYSFWLLSCVQYVTLLFLCLSVCVCVWIIHHSSPDSSQMNMMMNDEWWMMNDDDEWWMMMIIGKMNQDSWIYISVCLSISRNLLTVRVGFVILCIHSGGGKWCIVKQRQTELPSTINHSLLCMLKLAN